MFFRLFPILRHYRQFIATWRMRIDMIPYISPYICTYMQYAYIAFSLMLFVFYYYSINDILDLVDFQFTGLGSKIEIFAQVPVILPQ